ncbi:hypothetical protein [Streptomyces albipurpureus]|uniref:Uncharacterized protein n=1 Tax=Streptomyces albipurpureus TaxID=2897419 RepID=A0ABT0UTH2_9ACTN|nr:hypothetical protein [Streptomyces sp. CWNU-1]MCM2391385.1 hypothetical protein [Streptomyces sp. CWNU-1]
MTIALRGLSSLSYPVLVWTATGAVDTVSDRHMVGTVRTGLAEQVDGLIRQADTTGPDDDHGLAGALVPAD